VVDRLVARARAERVEAPAPLALWRAEQARGALFLAKPRTFMNASGAAVAWLAAREGLAPAALLVICDDVNIALGRVRIRRGGSDGGHNGLASVGAELGTTEFARLRLGVGPRPPGEALREFVLGEFAADELAAAEAMLDRGAAAALAFAERGVEAAMREFNAEAAGA
jgi:PTH1 family peptidyl-tRNA hydrolase